MRDVRWQVEGRVILAHTEGNISIEDVRQNNTEIKMLLDAGQKPVHLIFYAPNMQNSPTNIQEIRNSLDFLRHPHLGWIISVGTNPLVNFVSTVVTHLFNIKIQQAASLEDAVETLKRLDSTMQA